MNNLNRLISELAVTVDDERGIVGKRKRLEEKEIAEQRVYDEHDGPQKKKCAIDSQINGGTGSKNNILEDFTDDGAAVMNVGMDNGKSSQTMPMVNASNSGKNEEQEEDKDEEDDEGEGEEDEEDEGKEEADKIEVEISPKQKGRGGRRKKSRSNRQNSNINIKTVDAPAVKKSKHKSTTHSSANTAEKLKSNATNESIQSQSAGHFWSPLPGYDDIWIDTAPCDLDTTERSKIVSALQITAYGPDSKDKVTFSPAVHVSSSLFNC